jgi:hypothetical protein
MRSTNHTKVAVVSNIILVMLYVTHAAFASNFEFNTIALTNDPAPGTEVGSYFTSFTDVAINESNQVFFRAFLASQSIDGCDEGLWIGTTNELNLIACDGDPAPDTEDGTVYRSPGGGFPSNGIPDDLGQVGFNSLLTGIDIFHDEGIWLGAPSNVRLLAREGDEAPGVSDGAEFIGLSNALLALSNNGYAAFQAFLTGTGIDSSNDEGIWLGTQADNLSLVAREGYQAPDMADGVVFSSIDYGSSRNVNDNGEVVFRARISGTGVTFENDTGFWIGGPHNLSLALRAGDHIPSLPVGSNYERLSIPSINNTGEIAFTSWVTGVPNQWWLWAGMPDSPQLVARAGDPAPGAGVGVEFGNILYPILINSNGEVAFKSFMYGSTLSVWAGPPGELNLIARAGDQAPDALPGFNFSNIGSISINANGSVIIDSSLTGSPPTSGVWLYTKTDGLRGVVVPGQSIEVRQGDIRTVSVADSVYYTQPVTGNEDGRRSSLSDSDKLAVRIYFDDGSHGVFLAKPIATVEVSIDIKPDSEINNINLKSNGVLPVAILTTATFDAQTVKSESVQFGPAGVVDSHGRAHVKDVDYDGDMDLLFHFPIQETGIQCGDTEAGLTGLTWDGTAISGTDYINTVGCR